MFSPHRKCSRCGAQIPARAINCPKCHWIEIPIRMAPYQWSLIGFGILAAIAGLIALHHYGIIT